MLITIAILLALFVLPHPWGLAAVVVAATIDVVETALFIWWSKRRKATVGVGSMVGKHGVVLTDLWPEGQVKIGGELWRARSTGGCERGVAVVVRGIDGLTLDVEPVGS